MTLRWDPVVGTIRAPKVINILIPEQRMLPYMAKGALQMSLRILRWAANPGLSRWALNVVTCVLIRRRHREI